MKLRWFFAFFLISGFCSLIYEVVWLRLAMARFGVTTPLTSIVLSIFMAGLALGSIFGGKFAKRFESRALTMYGVVEFFIGVGGLAVPSLLDLAYEVLRRGDRNAAWDSGSYYFASGTLVAITLLPWCTAMGATFPLAMAAIRRITSEDGGDKARHSFSFLYLANVLGAILGALTPAFILIELFGFRTTLWIAAACNGALGATAILLSLNLRTDAAAIPVVESAQPAENSRRILVLLFATGLCSMAMEVVWIRLFTVFLGNVVYAFAVILAIYLAATFAGSLVYRRMLARGVVGGSSTLWVLIAVTAILPLAAADPWLLGILRNPSSQNFLHGAIRALFGIGPFSALLGFVTPQLVDTWSGGAADRAGRAYAINVCGAILGPLLAGFWLLPAVGEQWALFTMAATLGAISAVAFLGSGMRTSGRLILAPAALIVLAIMLGGRGYEDRFPEHEELRDHTATVIATGEGMYKQLLVNGVGMTNLTTITKVMTHFPLTLLGHPPQRGLVICFGMGTSFRSMLTWGIPTTAVELVPSVPKLFGYFHNDGDALLQSPLAHVVIDDGRRFLDRSTDRFDVIVVDPPPPISAPASSLLYSRQFYAVIRRHLAPGGILQVWYPDDGHDLTAREAVTQSMFESFPYVRAYRSIENWGVHFLASETPLQDATAEQLAARLPARSAVDLIEWMPGKTPVKLLDVMLHSPMTRQSLQGDGVVQPIDDDRPINEYYLLRLIRPKRGR